MRASKPSSISPSTQVATEVSTETAVRSPHLLSNDSGDSSGDNSVDAAAEHFEHLRRGAAPSSSETELLGHNIQGKDYKQNDNHFNLHD